MIKGSEIGMNKKGIIFDFDGTMVQTENVVYDAISEYLIQEHHFSFSKVIYKEMLGQVSDDFYHKIDNIVGTKVNQEAMDEYISEKQQKIYPNMSFRGGIEQTILWAKKQSWKIGVVSNSMYEELDLFIKTHSHIFDKVDTIVTIDDLVAGKPSPEGYLKAADDLELAEKEIIVVEDSMVGVQAALKANFTTYVLPNEFTDIRNISKKAIITNNIFYSVKGFG